MRSPLLGSYQAVVGSRFDELVAHDGTPRPGWDALGLHEWDPESLREARGLATRLLEDDGVTYNPLPGSLEASGPRRTRSEWRLDPLPTILTHDDWSALERGVAQRTRLLDAIVTDLYGPRRLLTSGLVPPDLLWRHSGYLRPAWGLPSGRPRIVLSATDVGRAEDGSWRAISDRTQAPSGLGYAMENRRVVARLLPDAYRSAELHRLTGFFGQVRDALADLAAPGIEDPRVVVLTPGRHSETAFDQAYIASLLGFPLVGGADLMMRDGRVWTRELEGRRQVDVVLRRVDDTWCDPLELRGESELGVPGFLEACRRGTVTSANGFGAGLVESPAYAALLPRLCEALLDEPLLLPSATSWWCGDATGLSHVLAHLDRLIIRPVSPAAGRGVYGPGLSAHQRERWRARIAADPVSYVGQEVLPLSTTPTVAGFGLGARPLTLRVFAVAKDASYVVMPGALGRIVPEAFDPATGRRDRVALSKDVWVLKAAGAVPTVGGAPEHAVMRPSVVPAVPRALENLFWMGRYTERAESTTRHVLALRGLVNELPQVYADPGRGAVDVLAAALTHVTTTYPGLAHRAPTPGGIADATVDAELRSLLVDAGRTGSVAQSLEGLTGAAGSVRDQLSSDVFTVLGGLERACAGLEATHPTEQLDLGSHVVDTGIQVLSGTLALTGITAENMVRDAGWHLLDIGRGLERALQTISLVRWVLGEVHDQPVERHLVAAVLVAGESVLTHRRRYSGSQAVDTMLDLMLLDEGNPRSVAFQVARVRRDVDRLPAGGTAGRLSALIDELSTALTQHTAPQLAAATPVPGHGDAPGQGAGEVLLHGRRDTLVRLCEELRDRLTGLADALAATYFWHPSAPRPLVPERPREVLR